MHWATGRFPCPDVMLFDEVIRAIFMRTPMTCPPCSVMAFDEVIRAISRHIFMAFLSCFPMHPKSKIDSAVLRLMYFCTSLLPFCRVRAWLGGWFVAWTHPTGTLQKAGG